jgi:hypothetical protein
MLCFSCEAKSAARGKRPEIVGRRVGSFIVRLNSGRLYTPEGILLPAAGRNFRLVGGRLTKCVSISGNVLPATISNNKNERDPAQRDFCPFSVLWIPPRGTFPKRNGQHYQVKFTRHMSHPLDGTFFSKKKVPERKLVPESEPTGRFGSPLAEIPRRGGGDNR